MITGKYPSLRLRRNRKYSWSRKLIQENTLSPSDFILPIFLIDGSNKKETINSMPGVYRYTINRLSQIVDRAIKKKIPMVALFPKTKNNLKNKIGSGVIALGVASGDKVSLIAGVTKDLTGKVKAGELVNHMAGQVGGKGGGRPDMAQAGGSEPQNLTAALDSVTAWLTERT